MFVVIFFDITPYKNSFSIISVSFFIMYTPYNAFILCQSNPEGFVISLFLVSKRFMRHKYSEKSPDYFVKCIIYHMRNSLNVFNDEKIFFLQGDFLL